MLERLAGEGIHRIAVMRALALGDLLCAVPALRAIKAAWPRSELTLIGLPWARELCERLACVDRFIEFPGFPGLPRTGEDLDSVPDFLSSMRGERFDLLLQMQGGGNLVNPLIALCGARHSAGFVEPGGWCPTPSLFTAWPRQGHEIERMLALTDHLGLPRCGSQLEFPVREADRRALRSVWPEVDRRGPIACVHPGAQLASRRWPASRFSAAADLLAERGYRIVLTGTATEAALVAQVKAEMLHPAVDLAGRTDLWMLGALIERADLLVGNDTGVSHIASALRTPSVIISSGADATRWAPQDNDRHQVLWSDLSCRPCGFRACPHDHACAKAITPQHVVAAVTLSRAARQQADAPTQLAGQ
jgi:ADP-heptose:LPS heptosyltransferase